MDADGTLYIGYRWARSSWLEKNADSTLLRGIALRAGRNLQEKLFSLPADAPCAEAVAVSYTHLDVYKRQRQGQHRAGQNALTAAGHPHPPEDPHVRLAQRLRRPCQRFVKAFKRAARRAVHQRKGHHLSLIHI